MSEYDLVIIGGGPGGLTAGLYAMRAAMKTVLIEKGAFGGQMTLTDAIENYPGFEEINGFDLSQKFLNHAQKFGLETIQENAENLKTGNPFHEVKLANGDVIKGRSVILACGGSSRKIGIPGEAEFYGKGVSYCATCDGFFFRNKIVAVIGGGDSAVEEAIFLSKLAEKVYLIHRRDELRASPILQKRVKNTPKVEILWNKIPLEIKNDGQTVNGIALKDTKTDNVEDLSVNGVFVFIGHSPNNSIVPSELKKNEQGFVVTDEACRTTIPGLYVIGDLRNNYAKQIVIAAGEGAIAALDAEKYVQNQND